MIESWAENSIGSQDNLTSRLYFSTSAEELWQAYGSNGFRERIGINPRCYDLSISPQVFLIRLSADEPAWGTNNSTAEDRLFDDASALSKLTLTQKFRNLLRHSYEGVRQIRASQSQFRNQSDPSQADHAGAEFAAEVELQGFAFECCLQTMFFRPSLLDFATSLGEWDLHGLRKRFAEGVGDEQGAFAILRGAQYGLPTLRVTPTLAGLGVEGGMAVADDWIYAPVEFHGRNAELPLCW